MASVSLVFSTQTHFFYGLSNLEPHRDEPLGSKFLIIYTGAFTEKQRTGSRSEWGKKSPSVIRQKGLQMFKRLNEVTLHFATAMKVYREMASC